LTKTLDTLVPDLYDLLENPPEITKEDYKTLGERLGEAVKQSFRREKRGTLRMSSIGQPCERKLWYSVNQPEKAEPLKGPQFLKFMFGHIIEDVVLWMAELAGHSVTGRQDELEIAGVKGHRDTVLDGVTVDAKSASTYSFKKFKDHLKKEEDSFGYIDQLQSYIHCGEDDPLVLDKSKGAFVVIDKTLGNITVDVHEKEDFPITAYYERKKNLVASPDVPPRGFDPVPMGEGGNEKLPTVCAYCDFKKTCHPDLRTFLYSYGPVYLSKVTKEPKVPEVFNEEEITSED
jgi:hypothetical protein